TSLPCGNRYSAHLVEGLFRLGQPGTASRQGLLVFLGLAFVTLGPGLLPLGLQVRDHGGQLLPGALGTGASLRIGPLPLGLLGAAHTVLDLAESTLQLITDIARQLSGSLPGLLVLT